MRANVNKITTINAPRSFPVFLLQLMSISPVATGVIIVVSVFVEDTPASLGDMLFLLFPTVVLFGLAFVTYYLPSRRITRVIFDPEARVLTKAKRGEEPRVFDLTGAQQILSKRTFTNPGWKYSMVVQDRQGGWQSIVDEDTPYGGKHWAVFSETLSQITGLPVKQELWGYDLNGRLLLIPAKDVAANRKRKLLPLLVVGSCAFVGAILFRVHPTLRFFLYAGLASVSANTAISLAYAISKRDEMGDVGTNYFTLTVYILTLVIPYAFFYLLFAFLLNGFRLPMPG